MIKPEIKLVSVQAVGGLEVESQERLRSPNSWRRLENWDLFLPGSIRKILGFEKVGGVFLFNGLPDAIQAVREYRRTPAGVPVIFCIGESGSIYPLDGSFAVLTKFDVVDYPFVGMMSGLADGVSKAPPTPNPATSVLYMVVTPKSVRPQKWDLLNAVTPVGVSPPTLPSKVAFALITDNIVGAPLDLPAASPNTNPGALQLLVSRGYAWTYWAPETMHESSLSPVNADSYFLVSDSQDALGFTFTPPGGPALSNIIQLRVLLPTEVPDNPQYTRRRLYATRDGGQTFFLVQGLAGADSDDSIPLAQTEVLDGNPVLLQYILVHKNVAWLVIPGLVNESFQQIVPQTQPAETHPNGYLIQTVFGGTALPPLAGTSLPVTQDTTLVQPSPAEGENDPPPIASWGAVYQNKLWLLPRDDDSRVVFSKTNDFQSFPRDNFFDFPESNYDPVKALVPSYIQMLVGKIRSVTSLTGTSFLDFTTYPLDEHIGFVGRRSNVMVEGKVFYQSQQGVMVFEGNKAEFVGGPIRTLTDRISRTDTLKRIQYTVHMQLGMVLCHFSREDGKDEIFLYDLSTPASPWTEITYLPDKLSSLQTVLLPTDESEAVLFSDMQGNVFKLFSGEFAGLLPNNKPAPVEAVAETQLLPQDDPVSKKMFRRLYVELSDYDGLTYEFSVDDGPFTIPKDLKSNNFLGALGQQIVVRFRHRALPLSKEITLENYTIEYVSIGPARYR